jgi:Smg protein
MYIEAMFEVLVFVYENYWRGDACPELHQLGRKLNAVGFESDDIQQALQWLAGLNLASHSTELIDISQSASETHAESAHSLRIYSVAEQDHLGAESLGFVNFLESAGVLSAHMREIVIDRAMAVPGQPVSLDDLKIIVLMVYWSVGLEPDALVLDELCDDHDRVAH